MKKLLALFLLVCLGTTHLNAQVTTVLSQLTTQVLANGQTVLCYKGVPYVGTRGQVLDLEKINLAQPVDKSLMVLNEDGTGGCFGADKVSLFLKDPYYNYWVLKLPGLVGYLSATMGFDSNIHHSFISIYQRTKDYHGNEGPVTTQIIQLP